MIEVTPNPALEQTVNQRHFVCCLPAAQFSRWASPDRRERFHAVMRCAMR